MMASGKVVFKAVLSSSCWQYDPLGVGLAEGLFRVYGRVQWSELTEQVLKSGFSKGMFSKQCLAADVGQYNPLGEGLGEDFGRFTLGISGGADRAGFRKILKMDSGEDDLKSSA